MSQRTLLRFLIAFAAGFMSTLVFNQGTLAFLHAIAFTPIAPYPTAPTRPFGVPFFWSAAFWGGIWGIGLAAVIDRIQQRFFYWGIAFIFGMIAPTLVSIFVVFPIQGVPITPNIIFLILMVNAAWGIGTAFFLQFQSRSLKNP
ncbi:hypothetical protein [Chamaesiphon sp.]|uniref:hypothetical protein n=1 Tax=Chamaesiphon sp. TaxID=2814140 RepID=UPI003593B354